MTRPGNNLDFVICGLEEIPSVLDAHVTHAVSILDPGIVEPPGLEALGARNVLRLRFHDVIEELPAMDAPAVSHIEALLTFSGGLAERSRHRVLIHCHMGISRSTAAAITLLAERTGDPAAAVARVTEHRPIAWPNLRMIELADAHLGMGQDLVRAVRRHYARALQRRPELKDAFIRSGRAREVEGLEGL